MWTNIADFLRAALPFVRLGLAIAVFCAQWGKKNREKSASWRTMRRGQAMIVAGLACYLGFRWLNDLPAFADQEFLEGIFIGVEFALLLSGVFVVGRAQGLRKQELRAEQMEKEK